MFLGLFKFKLFVMIMVEGIEKDMKNNTRRMFGLGISVVMVLLLVVFVIYVSYLVINNIYNDPILKVNKKTANYISFLFEDNNDHIIEVKNPKIVNDEIGKLLFGEDIYTLDIKVDENMDLSKEVEYVVICEALSKNIDDEYVKFYITDKNDKSLVGGNVPLYSEFNSDGRSGKVIYTGKISKDNLDEQLKIRVWVSDEYKSNDVLGFSYHLDVIVKNS